MTRCAMRQEALAQDWNRLRDHEREWRVFADRVGKVGLAIGILAVIGLLAGCTDSEQKRCDRWTALAVGYTMCIKDPACTMETKHYLRLNEAKAGAIKHCEVRP
jgi:hypothetical protein